MGHFKDGEYKDDGCGSDYYHDSDCFDCRDVGKCCRCEIIVLGGHNWFCEECSHVFCADHIYEYKHGPSLCEACSEPEDDYDLTR